MLTTKFLITLDFGKKIINYTSWTNKVLQASFQKSTITGSTSLTILRMRMWML